jgi:hypothetical protein
MESQTKKNKTLKLFPLFFFSSFPFFGPCIDFTKKLSIVLPFFSCSFIYLCTLGSAALPLFFTSFLSHLNASPIPPPAMSIFYQALTSTPFDDVSTPTSEEQEEVETSIQALLLPYQQSPLKASLLPSSSSSEPTLANSSSIPVPDMNKAQHIAFLRKVLDPLPAPYVAFDSTRCWLIYWVAHSYYLLGEEFPESLRRQAISTLLHFQDKKNGGFGSGQGQIGHLMATYATIMAMTILGSPGQCPEEEEVTSSAIKCERGGWDDIDR